jgi:hypothetical protein
MRDQELPGKFSGGFWVAHFGTPWNPKKAPLVPDLPKKCSGWGAKHTSIETNVLIEITEYR